MKSMLEDIWYSYVIDKKKCTSVEERKLINTVLEIDEAIRKTMNAEQKELLQKYDDSVSLLSMYNEKNAFIKGVHFATEYFVEAMQSND